MAVSKHQLALGDAIAALAKKGQPKPLYKALDKAMGALIGHKLFTLMTFDAERRETQRVYSNQPKPYPVGGKKPYGASAIYDRLMIRHRPVVLDGKDDIVHAFVDHALILSLGCAASMHIPVVYDGRTLGIMNLLHKAGWYKDRHVAEATPFATLLAAPFLDALRG